MNRYTFENLDELRVDVPESAPPPPGGRPPKPQKKPGYVQIPAAWLNIIHQAKPPLSGATWTVVIRLIELFTKCKSTTVTLANAILEARGVGRKGKMLALDRLVELGLIKTEGNPKQAPRVTALVDPFGWE
jgi:hypothetical protein